MPKTDVVCTETGEVSVVNLPSSDVHTQDGLEEGQSNMTTSFAAFGSRSLASLAGADDEVQSVVEQQMEEADLSSYSVQTEVLFWRIGAQELTMFELNESEGSIEQSVAQRVIRKGQSTFEKPLKVKGSSQVVTYPPEFIRDFWRMTICKYYLSANLTPNAKGNLVPDLVMVNRRGEPDSMRYPAPRLNADGEVYDPKFRKDGTRARPQYISEDKTFVLRHWARQAKAGVYELHPDFTMNAIAVLDPKNVWMSPRVFIAYTGYYRKVLRSALEGTMAPEKPNDLGFSARKVTGATADLAALTWFEKMKQIDAALKAA